ncbi:MAG: Chromate transport protein ChrA, partial [uncultured Thermoleophilia bacterium]
DREDFGRRDGTRRQHGRLAARDGGRNAARGPGGRDPPRPDVLRRTDGAHRLLPRGVRPAPPLARRRRLRRADGALPVPPRPRLEPARRGDRAAAGRRPRGPGGVRRLHAPLGRAHGAVRLRDRAGRRRRGLGA